MPAPDPRAALIEAIRTTDPNLDYEDFADTIIGKLATDGLHIEEDWIRRQNREKAERAAERERYKAAAMAGAIPYAGAITYCQATVTERAFRGATFVRCSKKARFVVRREEKPGEKGSKYDGRLAVCKVHASDKGSRRYMGHWSHERDAGEPVEPEYQP